MRDSIGIVSGAVKSTAWTTAVLGRFRTARGLALGLTLSGAALAQMGVPPLVNWLIETFGRRMAFVSTAMGWCGITFLLCLFVFFDAHGDAAPSPPATELPGLTKAQAVRDTALWRLAFSTLREGRTGAIPLDCRVGPASSAFCFAMGPVSRSGDTNEVAG